MSTKKRNKSRVSSSFSLTANRKGQVTVFIIVGIVILFAFAGVLLLSKTVTKKEITAAGEPVITTVPQEFQPIQTYTENCLNQIARRGLFILGEQGGYIYPDLVGEYSLSSPTESDGISLEPLKVPYWHYNSEPNQGKKVVYASLQPKLSVEEDPELSIEAQLSRFVRENIDTCLDSYQPFVEQGFTIELPGAKEVEVKVGEETVNFLLEMEVEAKKGDSERELDQFFIKVPLRLKHYYEVANEIADAEREFKFLESHGLELISIYSRKDSKYFPPQSDVTYELFSPLSWSEFSLKEKFKEILVSYIPLLRFLGSDNFYYAAFPEGNLLAQKVIDNMVIPLIGAEDLEIGFDYFNWELYFKTNSEDGIIKPEHIFVNYEILTFGQQRYETHYDASYPVLVTVRDNTAFNGQGYNLVFALESNIRNNQPAVHNEVRETYPQRISSLICDQEQRETGLLKAVVVDSFTKEPLELVKVGFTIPEQAECEIGLTNEQGEIESNFPAVYGGRLSLIRSEYLTSFYPINTYNYKGSSALLGYSVAEVSQPEKVIELDKIKKINVAVQKKELKKCLTPLTCDEIDILVYKDISCEKASRSCFFNAGDSLFLGDPVLQVNVDGSLSKYHDYYFVNKEKVLLDQEEVVCTLERVEGFRSEIINNDFSTSFAVKGEESTEIQLVPGKYKVSCLSTLNEKISIPTDKRCFQYDILTREEEECFNLEGQEIEKYLNGNLKWDTTESYFVVTPEQLYTAQELTLYVLNQDLLSVPERVNVADYRVPGLVVEDLNVPGEITKLSQEEEIRAALEPEFS